MDCFFFVERVFKISSSPRYVKYNAPYQRHSQKVTHRDTRFIAQVSIIQLL
jgi:hypothetical protein